MKAIIDTNGFLRVLLNDIPEQANQVELILKKAKKKKIKIIVPQIIIFEIDYTLRKFYKLEKEEVINKIKVILSSNALQIESKELFSRAILLYEKNNVSLVDCFIFAIAEAENAKLFTFDKKLKKLR